MLCCLRNSLAQYATTFYLLLLEASLLLLETSPLLLQPVLIQLGLRRALLRLLRSDFRRLHLRHELLSFLRK